MREPGQFQYAGTAIRERRADLQAAHLERIHAQDVRHTCAVCGETRSGRFGDTLAWFKDHAKTCRKAAA